MVTFKPIVMKKYVSVRLVCIIMFFTCYLVYSQQESQYTQYMYNTISFNSAYTGSRDNPNFLLLHRTQWVGLDGAPETQNFSFHTPLPSKNMGLGLVVINDKFGPSKEVNVNVNYSYSIFLKEDTRIALGLSGGIQSLDTDWSRGSFNNLLDPVFQENVSFFKPTLGVGSYLYSDDWYLGLSVPNLLRTQYFDEVQSTVATKRSQIYLMAGYVFYLSSDLKFKPATLTKIISGSPISIDLSANFMYQEQFVIGLAGSLDNSLSLLTGYQITPSTLIGYAFDYNTNNLGNYNSGSHELFIRFELSKTKYLSPRFF